MVEKEPGQMAASSSLLPQTVYTAYFWKQRAAMTLRAALHSIWSYLVHFSKTLCFPMLIWNRNSHLPFRIKGTFLWFSSRSKPSWFLKSGFLYMQYCEKEQQKLLRRCLVAKVEKEMNVFQDSKEFQAACYLYLSFSLCFRTRLMPLLLFWETKGTISYSTLRQDALLLSPSL